MTEPEDHLIRRLRAAEISRPGIDLEDALARHVRRRAQVRPLRWMLAAAAAAWLVVFLGGSLSARDLRQLGTSGVAVTRESPDPDYLRGMLARRLEALQAAENGNGHDQQPAQKSDRAAPEPPTRRGQGAPMPVSEGVGCYV
jgi:hypothetical protein